MGEQAIIPEEIDEEAASQLAINPMTVRGILHVLQIPEGEYLLQSAAGSALGRQLIQMSKHYGVKTINVVRRQEQREELSRLG